MSEFTIRAYRVSEEGEKEIVPVTRLGGSDDPHAYHPSAQWPACRCPRCHTGERTHRET